MAACAAAAICGIAQSGESGFVGGDEGGVLGGGEQLVLESIGECRFFLVELLQLCLVGVGEVGAGVDELLVDDLDEALRFGIELERIALVVDGLRRAEKRLGVEIDGVMVCGESRGYRLLAAFCSVGLVLAPVTASKAAVAR